MPRVDQEEPMTTLTTISVADIKRTIEGRDAKALADFYGDNAVLRIIDRDNPPSRSMSRVPVSASTYADP